MTEGEYIEQRLDNQIEWYSNKSGYCQLRFKSLRIIEIVAAAIIPLFSGMGDKIPCGSWIIGILGIIIAVIATISGVFKYHENWIQYRATAEALKHEKYLFLARSNPYDENDPFQTLVQRVEGLISSENITWTKTLKTESKSTLK